MAKPINVFTNALNPNGDKLRRSVSKPLVKPVTSPERDPLFIEINKRIINTKSGITGRKNRFDNNCVSSKMKKKHIKIEIQNFLIILIVALVCFPYRLPKLFPISQNQSMAEAQSQEMNHNQVQLPLILCQ